MMHTVGPDEDVVTPAVRRRMRRRRSPIDTSSCPSPRRSSGSRRRGAVGESDTTDNNADADNTDEGAAADDAELGSATADLDESLREAIDTIVAQRVGGARPPSSERPRRCRRFPCQ